MQFFPLSQKNQIYLKRFIILLLAIFTATFLFFIVREMDWSVVRRAKPAYFFYILGITIVNTILYSLLVFILIRSSGYKTTIQQAYLILTSSLTASYISPLKIGIPLRIYLYKEYMLVPASTGTALVAIEAFFGTLIPALIAIFGSALIFPNIGLFIPTIAFLIVFGGAVVGLIMPFEQAADFFANPNRQNRFSRLARLFSFFSRIQSGLKKVPPKALLAVILIDLAMIVLQAVRLYFVLLVLGVAIPIAALLSASTISATAGSLSMIPMGLGVQDASFTFLLVQLGIADEIAISAAVIQRLFSPGWPLLLGLISVNILGISELIRKRPEAIRPESGEER